MVLGHYAFLLCCFSCPFLCQFSPYTDHHATSVDNCLLILEYSRKKERLEDSRQRKIHHRQYISNLIECFLLFKLNLVFLFSVFLVCTKWSNCKWKFLWRSKRKIEIVIIRMVNLCCRRGKLSIYGTSWRPIYTIVNLGFYFASTNVQFYGLLCVFSKNFLPSVFLLMQITHMEMIKGIQGHGYYDELVIPIIENTAHERELTESLSQAVYFPLMSLFILQHHRGSAFLYILLVISASEQDSSYRSIPLGTNDMY